MKIKMCNQNKGRIDMVQQKRGNDYSIISVQNDFKTAVIKITSVHRPKPHSWRPFTICGSCLFHLMSQNSLLRNYICGKPHADIMFYSGIYQVLTIAVFQVRWRCAKRKSEVKCDYVSVRDRDIKRGKGGGGRGRNTICLQRRWRKDATDRG